MVIIIVLLSILPTQCTSSNMTMRFIMNPYSSRSLTYVVIIVLVFFAMLGNCHPTQGQRQPSDSLVTTNSELANITHAGNVSALSARALGFRPELARSHVCKRWFSILFDEWIVQVPPQWWKPRYVIPPITFISLLPAPSFPYPVCETISQPPKYRKFMAN